MHSTILLTRSASLCSLLEQNPTKEVWRCIPGYEGKYQASTLGNIRSLNYYGSKGRIQQLAPGYCQPKSKRTGTGRNHLHVVLGNGKRGKGTSRKVHRLVALTFIGEVPEDRTVVCHINGDETENRLSNLYYGTIKDNAQDSITHGTRASYVGANNNNSRLTEADVSWLFVERQLLGTSYRKLAAVCNVDRGTIAEFCKGNTWKHLQLHARFADGTLTLPLPEFTLGD